MKIARIFSRLNVGGPTLHVVNLQFELAQMHIDTQLMVGKVSTEEGDFSLYAKQRGVEITPIPDLGAKISPFKDLKAFFQILKALRKFRPDVVHTHTFKAGLLGRLAAFVVRVPVVVHTYHGHLLSGYLNKIQRMFLLLIEGVLNHFTSAILTVSEKVRKDLIDSGIVSAKKIQSLDLGFDLEGFRAEGKLESTLRKHLGIPKDAIVLGTVGRLVPVKGHDLFLEALVPLLFVYPQLHLCIIGDGPLRAELQAYSRNLGKENPTIFSRVHFTGWIFPMAKEYKDMNLCLCTSHNEGTSVAIIESILAGTPCLSVAVGGMGDLLEEGRFGYLIERNGPKIRSTVENFINTYHSENTLKKLELSEKTGQASHHFFKKFSSKTLANNIHKIYNDLLRES